MPPHRPRRGRFPTLPLVLILLAISPGCGGGTPPAPPDQGHRPAQPPAVHPPAAGSETVYPLVGVVRTVDREGGTVAIRHEAIPGYMPAMTMPFDLSGQEILAELQVGDTIEGTLRVAGNRSALTDVVITALAEPTPEPGTGPPPTLAPGDPVPDLAVTTQDGQPLRLSDLRGKTVVLTFIYTRCPLPDFCPLIDRKFAELARRLQTAGASEDVRLLSVSFDPEHDTPSVLQAHARVLGAQPPLWTFAVASHEALFAAGSRLGLTYAATGPEIIHSLTTALIGPDGRLIRLIRGNQWSATELSREVLGTRHRPDQGRP